MCPPLEPLAIERHALVEARVVERGHEREQEEAVVDDPPYPEGLVGRGRGDRVLIGDLADLPAVPGIAEERGDVCEEFERHLRGLGICVRCICYPFKGI